jgi:outer membrane protein insertion porin family
MRATFACLILWAVLAGLTQAAAPFPPRGTDERPIVSDVIIRGNRHLSAEYIKNLMKTRAGREFIPEVLQQDLRTLFSTRKLGNGWADKEDDGPGRVKVTVYVREKPPPIKKVVYWGHQALAESDLAEASWIRTGMPTDPGTARAACGRIVARYKQEGRLYASCELLQGGERDDTEVIFHITEGPRVRVKAVRFFGGSFVSPATLARWVNVSGTAPVVRHARPGSGGSYAALSDGAVNDLLWCYRVFGFPDVQIRRELTYSPDGREVSVAFHINEGPRSLPPYRVEDPESPYLGILKSIEECDGGSLMLKAMRTPQGVDGPPAPRRTDK